MASSVASTNSRPLASASPSRRSSPFPPAPKSVRVLSVFNEGGPDSPQVCPAPTGEADGQNSVWTVWHLGIAGIALISGLLLAVAFWGRG